MIGPPAWNFRRKKFELVVGSGGAGLASGITVAVTVGEVRVAGEVTAAGEVAAVSGAVPGAGGTAGATVVPGAGATEAPGAAASGEVARAGEVAGSPGGFIAGLVAGGAAGLCAKLVSATVSEQRLTISVFFIFSRVDGGQKMPPISGAVIYPKENRRASSKTFLNL